MDWKKLISELQVSGLSQAEIGDKINKSQAWVSAVSRGEFADVRWMDGEALRKLHIEKYAKSGKRGTSKALVA